ncbi:MAG TPA: VOC family protein [Sphingomicrobium sp.]|nr:VOC family protein [Sphingomicrobium sp.]
MFSHVMLGCSDRERSRKFYDSILGARGIRPHRDFGRSDWWMTREGALGVGEPIDGKPCSPGNGSTIGFKADSTEAVDAWHAAGIANGGTAIEDPPGIRDGGFGKMYLAYLRDPDGNKLCGYYAYPRD